MGNSPMYPPPDGQPNRGSGNGKHHRQQPEPRETAQYPCRGMTLSHTQLPRGTLTSPPNRGRRPRELTLRLKLRGIPVHRGMDNTPGDGAATLAPPHGSQLNGATKSRGLIGSPSRRRGLRYHGHGGWTVPHSGRLARSVRLFNSQVTARGRGRQTQRRKWTLASARDGYP